MEYVFSGLPTWVADGAGANTLLTIVLKSGSFRTSENIVKLCDPDHKCKYCVCILEFQSMDECLKVDDKRSRPRRHRHLGFLVPTEYRPRQQEGDAATASGTRRLQRLHVSWCHGDARKKLYLRVIERLAKICRMDQSQFTTEKERPWAQLNPVQAAGWRGGMGMAFFPNKADAHSRNTSSSFCP